jgi:hypothetical protein
MADPALYQQRDGSQISSLQERLAELEGELANAYRRWEELDELQ